VEKTTRLPTRSAQHSYMLNICNLASSNSPPKEELLIPALTILKGDALELVTFCSPLMVVCFFLAVTDNDLLL